MIMPSETKKYQEYARECVRLAGSADTIELREKLLGLARVWMEAVMNEEDAEAMRPSPSRAHEAKVGRPSRSRTLVVI
jgi:hypothetical protein